MLLALPCAALTLFPWNFASKRQQLELFARRSAHSVHEIALPPSAELAAHLWTWIDAVRAAGEPAVLSLPALDERELASLARLLDAAPDSLGLALQRLPDDAGARGLLARASPSRPPSGAPRVSAEDAEAHTRAWVRRALSPSGLALCPYTASDRLAGVKLEGLGVKSAPILHAVSLATESSRLLADLWGCISQMTAGGEEAYSSIVLSAPAFDDRWQEWHQDVFPLLEETVLACGLGRTLGVVCFHPDYETPPPSFLARHRFGHMHGLRTLRRWLDEQDQELSTRLSDEELLWASSYMRRSPHAVVNVLWSRQLEVAEQKRSSSRLYASNIARIAAAGRARLEQASAEERTFSGASANSDSSVRTEPGVGSVGTPDIGTETG